MKGGDRTERNFQGVVTLRERGWEGLPPPPVLTSGKPKPTGTRQEDPSATPVVTSLGLPNRDLESQDPLPPPLEPVATLETGTIHEPPVTSVIQSPSTSIATLSDFTVADASDDESPTSPTFADTSDDEPLVDPMAIVQHETFYLDDGNVEVLCGNTLFRVHVSTLSFHSPTLRQVFAQTILATAESPNGCPRFPSSDAAKDFATLLKIIYLPGLVALFAPRQIDPLKIRLSADSPNGIKCRISPHSRPSSGSRQSTRCPLSDLRYCSLRCVPRDIRRALSFQAARREGLQRTDSSLERGPQPLRPAETCICVTNGILHGSPKGSEFVDGRRSTTTRHAFPCDPSVRDQRTHDTPPSRAQRDPPFDFWTERLSPLLRSRLSLTHSG